MDTHNESDPAPEGKVHTEHINQQPNEHLLTHSGTQGAG